MNKDQGLFLRMMKPEGLRTRQGVKLAFMLQT